MAENVTIKNSPYYLSLPLPPSSHSPTCSMIGHGMYYYFLGTAPIPDSQVPPFAPHSLQALRKAHSTPIHQLQTEARGRIGHSSIFSYRPNFTSLYLVIDPVLWLDRFLLFPCRRQAV